MLMIIPNVFAAQRANHRNPFGIGCIRSHEYARLAVLRGGSSSSTAPTGSYYKDSTLPSHNDVPPSQYANTNENRYDEQYYDPPQTSSEDAEDPFHETVQERLDQWRTAQLENASKYQESPRDDKGRMKLLTSVGKGSRAAIFFFLMWRNVHLYETAVAVSASTAVRRLILTVPLIVLFIANMAGAVVSLTTPTHASKKRLKAILNLDKLVEVLLFVYSVVRLTVWPNPYTLREVYIGNCLHSAFFLLQCQAFTRLSWDETSAPPMSTYTTTSQQQQRQQEMQGAAPVEGLSSDTREDWYYDSSRSGQQDQRQSGSVF